MKLLPELLLVYLVLPNLFAAASAKEIMSPENIEQWKSQVEKEYQGTLVFDADHRRVIFNTFETKGYSQFFDAHQYVDFRIDCVVNFHKLYDHYSGLSLFLRDNAGSERYWVYWRPQGRDLYALKVRSDSGTVNDYDRGKKQADRPADIKLDKDYTLSVEMQGRNLRVFLDGKKMSEFTDPQPKLIVGGRMGFSALSCNLTIKSIKITDLTTGDKLPVKSHSYITPPDAGNPIVVYDLGQEYLVTGVRLNVPEGDIAAFRIYGSRDGKKWDLLVGQCNAAPEIRRQPQTLEGQCSGAARYVKVILYRANDDRVIKLGQVEILGRENQPNDKGESGAIKESTKTRNFPDKKVPFESANAWYLGNRDAAWAISKTTGQVVGGWNAVNQDCYLLSLQGRYHLENKKSMVTGLESDDKVLSSKFQDKNQQIELVCSNPKVPDLIIGKRYWIRDNKLFQRVAFTTRSNELQFLTYNTQATFEQNYRDAGYYMGGADGGGPLVPAPRISTWQKVVEHQNTTKGMVLHQPDIGYGVAQIRTRLDDQFVWPWFTGAIASYCEKENVMNYTPDGWDMSLGTSRLSQTKQTSYEQFLCVFPGDWQQFYRSVYAPLPEVQKALDEIPPVPDWVGDILVDTSSDINRVRRILDVTDEGNLTVLVDFGGSWADYYVDRGLEGGWAGGSIKAEEIRDVIRRIKSLSPRIKIGIYMWNLSTLENSRIFKKHPNWFRTLTKDGETLSTFPGFATNYAHLLSIPECYNELLSQFDLVLSYLGTDFIYLDDPKAINPIDWTSGAYTRDDLSFKFFLDIKRVAAKHGPDKMVFFNNRGNPYGDINYIEARSTIDANYWRQFTGISAVIQEFVSVTRPQARIVPLYYITPHERDYINRTLAMGWIPELAYGDVLERRPFIQAAYEIGNCATVPAHYSPDWKNDKATTLESYAVQRKGDASYLLSFISHAEKAQTVPVELDLDSLNLDRAGPVFIWQYVIEDANQYKGHATQSLARRAYKDTGWHLDRVTQRKLIYAGPYRKELAIGVNMEPLLLYQLYVTSQPAAVYSENSLAGNYLFAQKPKVKLAAATDWAKGTIEVQVDSNREEAEIITFVPMLRHRLDRVLVDGQSCEPALVWEGDNIFPVFKVSKGRHSVVLSFRKVKTSEPLAVTELSAAELQADLRIGLPEFHQAIFTIEKQGRPLYNRLAARVDRGFVLPLPSGRPQVDNYTVSLKAVVDGQGRIRQAACAPVNVCLSAAQAPDPGLVAPKPAMMPGQRQITDVKRDVRGVNVLRSAVLTTDTPCGTFQPKLEALTARVDPENLLLEAGTTRKIQDESRGAAFAGLEIKNLKKIQVKLANTFFNAFHARGKGFHIPLTPNSSNFAGIVVDYHTPQGYTKRVRLAVGVMHPECSSTYPDYGKGGLADEAWDLGSSLIEKPEKTFALDLGRLAPKDWDGQVWLSAGTDWIASDRRLTLQILAVNEAVTGECLQGVNPKACKEAYDKPKTLVVPRSPGGIILDGPSNEEWWRGSAETSQFFLNGGLGFSKATTTAKVLYDDTNLYIAFICKEPTRRKPFIQGGAIWDDDEVEVWIDADGDGKTFHQIVLNAANEKGEFSEKGRTQIGAKTAVYVEEGSAWMVEMAIPFAGLGVQPPKPGDKWRISPCRFRPPGQDFNAEQIVWAPLKHEGFSARDLANFGTLIFK